MSGLDQLSPGGRLAVEGNIALAKANQPACADLLARLDTIQDRFDIVLQTEPKAKPTVMRDEVNLALAATMRVATGEKVQALDDEQAMSLFRLLPQIRHSISMREAGSSAEVVSPVDMTTADFVNALSVAAVGYWLPIRGSVAGGRINVHPLNDPEPLVKSLEAGMALGQVGYKAMQARKIVYVNEPDPKRD